MTALLATQPQWAPVLIQRWAATGITYGAAVINGVLFALIVLGLFINSRKLRQMLRAPAPPGT